MVVQGIWVLDKQNVGDVRGMGIFRMVEEIDGWLDWKGFGNKNMVVRKD